jgi:N-acetylglucosaminyldiphosphoundecaprenol N-acetyl-beta-D-mannosaminyltransferase
MIGKEVLTVSLLGTPLVITDYQGLVDAISDWARRPKPTAAEFCNTQVVTMRRIDSAFQTATAAYDYFVPDGMPLVWCLRAMGTTLRDRVYGPTFLRHAMIHDQKLKHYFLGGSALTSQKLIEKAHALSDGRFQVVGANSSYAKPADSAAIVDEINRLSPDVIWVGLGTPKQQQWIHDNKPLIARGVLLGVGFAFDVNAGTKLDAPPWMQRLGLTWLFRLSQEPRRLLGRYLKYNTLFLFYCLRDLVRHFTKRAK